MEAAGKGRENVVVGRVGVVEYGFWQCFLALQEVQERGQSQSLWIVADGVEPRIWAQNIRRHGACVAQCTQVELHDPTRIEVETGEKQHQECRVSFLLVGAD